MPEPPATLTPGAALFELSANFAINEAEAGGGPAFCAALLLQGMALAFGHPEYARALLANMATSGPEAAACADDIVRRLPISQEGGTCITATGDGA